MFWVLSFSAFAIFLGIAAVGFLVLIISFFMGELFDFGHDFDHHVDVGDGVSFMSSRVLSVFVTAFGGFGAIGTHLGYSIGVSTAMGLAGGMVFGGLIYLFARFLYGQQASTDVSISELAGKKGQVSVTIPKGGVGQVRCMLGPTAVDKIARSKDGGEIAAGTTVIIEEIVGDTIVVRKAG
jgi:membrane protein implicated in regulation of membrane protease activity